MKPICKTWKLRKKLKTMISPNWEKTIKLTCKHLKATKPKSDWITDSPIREKQRNPHAKLANREIKAQTTINPRMKTWWKGTKPHAKVEHSRNPPSKSGRLSKSSNCSGSNHKRKRCRENMRQRRRRRIGVAVLASMRYIVWVHPKRQHRRVPLSPL